MSCPFIPAKRDLKKEEPGVPVQALNLITGLTKSVFTGFTSLFTPRDPLAVQLKAHTLDIHDEVEGLPFVKGILSGGLPSRAYAQHLVDLLHVRSAFEEALRSHRQHAFIREIFYPQLFREAALREDISKFESLNYYAEIRSLEPSEPARAYAAELASLTPLQLVAHAYTHNLADMFGGQILKRLIGRRWKGCTDFYTFDMRGTGADLLPSVQKAKTMQMKQLILKKSFIKQYKASLNRLKLSVEQEQVVLGQAKNAFIKTGAMMKVWGELTDEDGPHPHGKPSPNIPVVQSKPQTLAA